MGCTVRGRLEADPATPSRSTALIRHNMRRLRHAVPSHWGRGSGPCCLILQHFGPCTQVRRIVPWNHSSTANSWGMIPSMCKKLRLIPLSILLLALASCARPTPIPVYVTPTPAGPTPMPTAIPEIAQPTPTPTDTLTAGPPPPAVFHPKTSYACQTLVGCCVWCSLSLLLHPLRSDCGY